MRLALLLAMALSTLLTIACGGESAETPTDTPGPTATPGATPTPTLTPTPTPTPSPTATVAPTLTQAPTPKPTLAPTMTPVRTPEPTPTPTSRPAGALVPLRIQDPQAIRSALSEVELACVGDPAEFARALIGGPVPQSAAEQARLFECLEAETVARIFLASFVPGPEPLSPEASACVRAAFEVIDPRGVMTSGIKGNSGAAMAGSMAAFSVTTACLDDAEWAMAAPQMGIRPDERAGMQCLMAALGGPGPMAEALVATQQGDFTALTDAGLECGLDMGPPPGQPPTTPPPSPTPTPTPAPTAPPRPIPSPTPSVNPALAGYSALLAEAASSLPPEYDFVSDGLRPEEKDILDWADSRLFSNPALLASRWGPDNWPSEVRTESAQAIALLMLEIDIQKRTNGKHVVDWEEDNLDRVLDGLGIYEGVCISCYGKRNYSTVKDTVENHYPIVSDRRHVHREMLKTFAYFALADGEGILVRSFMENGGDDLDLLYQRDLSAAYNVGAVTDTEFGWRNLSFMNRITLSDGTTESFPTTVFKVIGDAASEREAVERWFGHLNKNLTHFGGDHENFADLFRQHSQTPYTPEPGYILLVREAGSPSSTGATTSAMRLLGLRADQFFSPNKGYRVGSVEIEGQMTFYEGNTLGLDTYTKNMPACALIRTTLDQVENLEFDTSCGR